MATATPLSKILELTFHDAVNGHLINQQSITREQIGEVYELARQASAERTKLVEALQNVDSDITSEDAADKMVLIARAALAAIK